MAQSKPVAPQLPLIDDLPLEGSAHDFLGLGDDAVAIANRITAYMPPSIAIYGAWGSGKSSLLNLIKEKLAKDSFEWVSMDAWAHQSEDTLLINLLSTVVRRSGDEDRQGIFRYLVAASASVLDTGIRIAAKRALDVDLSLKDLAEMTERGDMPKIEQSKQQVLREEFEKAVASFFNKRDRKLVIAIDNIDRCRPEIALRVIELLFPLTGIEHTTFIVAVDQPVLVSFINRDYHGTNFDGTRYLEKIFPVSYRIPDPWVYWDYDQAFLHTEAKNDEAPDQVYQLLGALLKNTAWDDRTPTKPDQPDPIFETVWNYVAAPKLMRNPRRIKRVARFIRGYAPTDRSDAETILFLVILADVWPEAFEFLLQTDGKTWEQWICHLAGVGRVKTQPAYLPLLQDRNLRDFITQIRDYYDDDKSFREDCPACDQEHLAGHFLYLREIGI